MVAAYKLGLIDDETLWIGMLTDRHLTSHTYHQQVAQRIFEAVRSDYAAALSAAVAACRALPA